MTAQKSDIIGISLVIIAAIGFALKGIFVKLTIAEGVSVPALMLWRYGIAIFLFWGVLLYRQRKHPRKNVPRKVIITTLWAGFFGYYMGTYADYRALELLDATISRFILFTFPVFVVLWHAIREKKLPPTRQIITIAIIQLGMYFLLVADGNALSSLTLEGAAWGLTSAFVYAIYLILIQSTSKQLSSITITTYVVTVAFIVTLAEFTTMQRWESELAINNSALIWLILTAIFSTFIPILSLAEGLSRIGASRAALISGFSPFFTILLAYVILGEIMTPNQWIGGMIIFISVLILEGKLPVRKLFRRAV